jgi:hypothetical protein
MGAITHRTRQRSVAGVAFPREQRANLCNELLLQLTREVEEGNGVHNYVATVVETAGRTT